MPQPLIKYKAHTGFKIASALVAILYLTIASALAQNGTYKYDPIYAGSFSPCGGNYTDSRNNSYYNGISYSDHYNRNTSSSQPYGQPSPDVWYYFTVGASSDITISLCGSSFDTYVHLLDGEDQIISNDDSDCGAQSKLTYPGLPAGIYYVVVEGYGSSTGNYTLQISSPSVSSPPAGANRNNAIQAGTFSSSGSFTHTMSNADPCLGNDIGQLSNDIYYQFTLTNSSVVTLSHCGSGFDTYMHLLNSSGGTIATNDDNNGPMCPGITAYLQTTLPAGTYYVVSEGA
ncbi:DVUA0089 family protein, partial [Pararcticibacter amylolyticus]|uniref:DVUA0089 family protein n=1 Tax=Pararcticibacter amylolyticus TaxID=2173175 RepID=UPI00192E7561